MKRYKKSRYTECNDNDNIHNTNTSDSIHLDTYNDTTIDTNNDDIVRSKNYMNTNNSFSESKMYSIMCYCGRQFLGILKFMFFVSNFYVLWIGLHYLSAHLYVYFCTPNTLIGFIISPFIAAAPHCQAFRWVIHNSANVINNMWTSLSTWLCSFLILRNNEL
jgi:hypothetical protein